MDGAKGSISPHQLYRRLGAAQAPIALDVRRPADFDASDRCIVSAYHRAPDDVTCWSKELPAAWSDRRPWSGASGDDDRLQVHPSGAKDLAARPIRSKACGSEYAMCMKHCKKT